MVLMKVLQVPVSDELHKAIKLSAVDQGVTMLVYIRKALEALATGGVIQIGTPAKKISADSDESLDDKRAVAEATNLVLGKEVPFTDQPVGVPHAHHPDGEPLPDTFTTSTPPIPHPAIQTASEKVAERGTCRECGTILDTRGHCARKGCKRFGK